MKVHRALSAANVVLLVCVVAVATAGCTGGPPTEAVAPGVEKGALGGAEVVGYLEAPATEGGAWTVYDMRPSTSSAVEPTALATLEPGSVDQAGIEALEGRYVWAAGRGSNDEVPEIRVDGIEPAEAP